MRAMHASRSSGAAIAEDRIGPAEHDLRGLPCPLPLERAVELADALAPDQAVCVLTPQRPLPLLDLLVARGLQVTTSLLDDGSARVLIHRPVPHGQTCA
jgi:hypothetical protein